MKLSEFDFYLEDFLLYCQNKNLSPKTLSSYEQSLRRFFAYLTTEHGVERLREVRTGHIRQYIAYIQERGKYMVVNREASKQINHPENRTDYKKQVSSVTINNYIQFEDSWLWNTLATASGRNGKEKRWSVWRLLDI